MAADVDVRDEGDLRIEDMTEQGNVEGLEETEPASTVEPEELEDDRQRVCSNIHLDTYICIYLILPLDLASG